jgi:hypothetical protein
VSWWTRGCCACDIAAKRSGFCEARQRKIFRHHDVACHHDALHANGRGPQRRASGAGAHRFNVILRSESVLSGAIREEQPQELCASMQNGAKIEEMARKSKIGRSPCPSKASLAHGRMLPALSQADLFPLCVILSQSRCRCGNGEASPGADVEGRVESRCRCGRVGPVPVQIWQAALSEQKHVHPGRHGTDRGAIELKVQPTNCHFRLPAMPTHACAPTDAHARARGRSHCVPAAVYLPAFAAVRCRTG